MPILTLAHVCRPFDGEYVMTYTQPKETSWSMRLEELEKACSRELAACLLGLKAHQTDAVSEQMQKLTEKQVEGEPDWLWNAKWCWNRVRTEIYSFFSHYRKDAAEFEKGKEVIKRMTEIYVKAYPEAKKDDVEEAILDYLDERAKKHPRPASAAGTSAKKKRARHDVEINLEEIQDKARKKAETEVRGQLQQLEEQAEKYESLQQQLDLQRALLDKANADLAAEMIRGDLATTRLATLKSHVLASREGFKLVCDDENQWTFVRIARDSFSPVFGRSLGGAAPNVNSGGSGRPDVPHFDGSPTGMTLPLQLTHLQAAPAQEP